jgi:membrane protein implicated in regulation of membrane protease activity
MSAMAFLQNTHALVWLVIAIVLAGIEVASTSLGFILASFAAVVSCLLAIFSVNFEIQVVTFSVITILSLTIFRPRLVKWMHRGTKTLPGRAEFLVGNLGQVTDEISNGQGRITVLDQDWAARSVIDLKSGTAVKVVGHDGIVLIVEAVK